MPKTKAANISNFHVQYSDLTSQHWHPNSESYAGGDNLITAIAKNWDIAGCKISTHWYAGMRSVRVYNFTLTKEDRTVIMPVLDNPYVERFIIDQKIEITETEDVSI